MTVNDSDVATANASHNAIITTPPKTNFTTSTEPAAVTAENNTSVRQLIDGQEYPVAKSYFIKKGFDL